MKKIYFFTAIGAAFIILLSANRPIPNPYGLKQGAAEIKSISAISFGPDGILFIGDSKSAMVFAIDTKDKTMVEKATATEVKNIDQKIAAALGTEAKNVRIQDIAVNPISKKVYIAVQSNDGTPLLLTLEGDKIVPVNLKDISHSSISIANVPGDDMKDRNGRPLRDQSISDLNYADGSVMLSGLSNQEFGSTFRKISFPFSDKQEQASLEIYHAAHGKFETNAPIRTFTTAELNGKKYLVASYTCTPLVLFPLDELKPGKHVKGRTVAEFGAGNSPVDMITLKKDGISYLFMANTNRPVMRINYKNIESYEGTLTEPIKESYGTAGVSFTNLPAVNVLQMDKLDETQVLVLQRRANGDLDLYTARADRWM
ncbi:hypothetical protein CAP36_08615 [Chitinophagaceae bacterium IBVUCB2]|nr:hypothetical protein CAP36_08615 [Chitinophagaceae bacterium IBVUCB2]